MTSIAQLDRGAFFTDDRSEIMQDWAKHCNNQKVYKQKSWKVLAFDNIITIIPLVACSAIACASVSMFKMTALVAIPMLYRFHRIWKAEKEAKNRFLTTNSIFEEAFSKYTSLKGFSISTNESWNQSTTSFLQDCKSARNSSDPSQKLAQVEKILSTYGDDEQGLGSLAQEVSTQLIKDQKYSNKMKMCKNACYVRISKVISIALVMDGLLGPYSFLSSKKSLVALLTGFSLFVAKQVVDLKLFMADGNIRKSMTK